MKKSNLFVSERRRSGKQSTDQEGRRKRKGRANTKEGGGLPNFYHWHHSFKEGKREGTGQGAPFVEEGREVTFLLSWEKGGTFRRKEALAPFIKEGGSPSERKRRSKGKRGTKRDLEEGKWSPPSLLITEDVGTGGEGPNFEKRLLRDNERRPGLKGKEGGKNEIKRGGRGVVAKKKEIPKTGREELAMMRLQRRWGAGNLGKGEEGKPNRRGGEGNPCIQEGGGRRRGGRRPNIWSNLRGGGQDSLKKRKKELRRGRGGRKASIFSEGERVKSE